MDEVVKADTPATDAPATAPATAPADTPATAVETVTLPKADVERLKAQTSTADAKVARYEKVLKLNGIDPAIGAFHVKPPKPADAPATAPATDEAFSAEATKAKDGLLGLALNPVYRDVLDANPDLKSILVQNPLALLPIYAKDALDGEDAVTLVEDELKRRLGTMKPAPTTPPATTTDTPPVPPKVPVNVLSAEKQDSYKELEKKGDVAGMIAMRMNPGGKKN